MFSATEIFLGDIYLVEFTGIDSMQQGRRPAVVFQNNLGNKYSPNVIVLPITSRIKKSKQPTHVFVSASDSGLIKDSMVLCENPICIPKSSLDTYLTTLPNKYMALVAAANILSSCAISYMNPEDLYSVWLHAAELNSSCLNT